jgi:hypothetical protein
MAGAHGIGNGEVEEGVPPVQLKAAVLVMQPEAQKCAAAEENWVVQNSLTVCQPTVPHGGGLLDSCVFASTDATHSRASLAFDRRLECRRQLELTSRR